MYSLGFPTHIGGQAKRLGTRYPADNEPKDEGPPADPVTYDITLVGAGMADRDARPRQLGLLGPPSAVLAA